jgi:hypothetical protein
MVENLGGIDFPIGSTNPLCVVSGHHQLPDIEVPTMLDPNGSF